jgi:hypothetical protein
MNPPSPIHLVLCEGTDDQRVMEGLAAHSGILDQLRFLSYAESGTLRSFLVTLSKSPEFTSGEIQSILITRDADDNHQSCWQTVRDAAQAAFGAELFRPGQWQDTAAGLKVGAWINPAPGENGMLESLCLQAARDSHAEIFPCIDSFVECIANARQAPLHEKSRFSIWSIVAQGPGPKDRLSIAKALEKLPPNWDHPAFAGLSRMLREAAAPAVE